MTSSLSPAEPLSELEIIQNPALGAYTIWQFGLGFQGDDERPPAFLLAFLVLPLLLYEPTLQVIGSTRKTSGIALFSAKLGEERENLLAVHDRALALRRFSLQSIGVGVSARLLTIDYDTATLRANQPDLKGKKLVVPERLRGFAGAAEKIGYWFSKVGLHQVTSTLKVEF